MKVCEPEVYAKHSVHWGINHSKTPPTYFWPGPPLNLQTVQAPFSGNSPYILVFWELPLKIGFFSEPP